MKNFKESRNSIAHPNVTLKELKKLVNTISMHDEEKKLSK
jgi:hypothetical protein